jgi:Zn-dependent peptidase ImmA (M78 family)
MTLPDGKLKAVYKKGDKFCNAKKVKGKKTFTPIESQPENVIELVRNYSVLKKDATYRRRISSFLYTAFNLPSGKVIK